MVKQNGIYDPICYLFKFLNYAYKCKLKELQNSNSKITLKRIRDRLKIVGEIERLLELLEIMQLQHLEIETVLNYEI